jgi:cell division initiation protein
MKLTPLDIRKHEFARAFRGYDPDEVRPFLEMLSGQWEEMHEELRHAQDRVREIENKIAHYEKVEVALQEALEAAKASALRTQTHAEERSRLMIDDAELKAEQILREAEQERFRLRQDVSKLSHRHAEVTARLRHFLMAELEILAQHEEERPIGFMKLIPAREAETLPPPPEQEHRQAVASREPAPAAYREPQPSPFAEREEAASQTTEDEYSGRPAEPAPAGERAGTTYADLYARASRRNDEMYEEAGPEPEPEPVEEEDEPAWTLRSLVSDHEQTGREDVPEAGSSEKEHIRRILEDLD